MKTYDVEATWSEGWWLLTVPDAPGAISQARSLGDEAETNIREAIACVTGDQPDAFEICLLRVAVDSHAALDQVRQHYPKINWDASRKELDDAVEEIRHILAQVAGPTADFVLGLDDGTGCSNSTVAFAAELAHALGERSLSFAMGFISAMPPQYVKVLGDIAFASLLPPPEDDEDERVDVRVVGEEQA